MSTYELTLIDRHFARFICSEAGGPCEVLKVAASLLSNGVGNGSICLNLNDIANSTICIDGEETRVPALEELQIMLKGTSVVGSPGQYRPLILDGIGRLYLYRYWKYERDLVRVILEKVKMPCADIDEGFIGLGLRRLFPNSVEGIDWQMVAAVAALRKGFCVISGGPGTGKTSTVVRILALLLEQAQGEPMHIALTAPTGKSAARLKESVSLLKEKLTCADAVKEAIPKDVSTIHRLLGTISGSVHFRHSMKNLLPYDVIVVDEASMVPLPLMAKLALALKDKARLILLGDRDQLASVEAGAVLGDVCGDLSAEPFSFEFSRVYGKATGVEIPPSVPAAGDVPYLTDSLVILKQNYRFSGDSGIGALAKAVNAGRGTDALSLLKSGTHPDIEWRTVPKPHALREQAAKTVVDGYRSCLAAATAGEALALFDTFRLLCTQRQGIYGVTGLNTMVEEILAETGLIDPRIRWYRGRPIMITVNDYNLKLFNGDVGIVFPDPEAEGAPRVFFATPDGGIRKVSPVRLPPHETVFAMTIHKSQGSEFDRVLMVLAGSGAETMTRELIYTGITRGKNRVEIWGDEGAFTAGVGRRMERKSGLKEALWGSKKVL